MPYPGGHSAHDTNSAPQCCSPVCPSISPAHGHPRARPSATIQQHPVSEVPCTASRALENRKQETNTCLSIIHLPHVWTCPCPPVSCPVALAACWQKPHALGLRVTCSRDNPRKPCSVDQFDSCSIWDDLAGKWQGFSKGQQNCLQFFS